MGTIAHQMGIIGSGLSVYLSSVFLICINYTWFSFHGPNFFLKTCTYSFFLLLFSMYGCLEIKCFRQAQMSSVGCV